ncbi:MAG: hypothetical protein IJ493_02560 [Clostridia bacterium]|nr:hypothetical protein [Clostridia bacterium]
MLNCDIREFGAVGDGVTLCTESIQSAIDACGAAGGGRVTIAGGRYLSARIDLRSGVELHIDVDGVLLATTDGSAFKEIETDFWITDMAPRRNKKCFIYAEGCHDIAITGRGMIDCQGRFAVEKVPEGDPSGFVWGYRRKVFDLPARMILFMGCKDVICEDVLLYEPCSGWGYWVCDCDRVTMRGLRVESDPGYPNADGIHVNCSRDVRISDCTIQAGDDAIVVRAYTGVLHKKTPCERVLVTNCNLSSMCSCIRVAWVNDWIIRDCVFSNLTFHDCNTGVGMTIPTVNEKTHYTDDGGDFTLVERLTFSNITTVRCYHEPLIITLMPGCQVEAIRDIRFSGILSECGYLPGFVGRADAPLERISFSDCDFRVVDYHGEGPSRSSNMRRGSATEPRFEYCRDLRMNNTSFTSLC